MIAPFVVSLLHVLRGFVGANTLGLSLTQEDMPDAADAAARRPMGGFSCVLGLKKVYFERYATRLGRGLHSCVALAVERTLPLNPGL